MSNANVDPKVGRLARMALLVAIIILLTFTPLGYITLPFIAATTIQMPVIIGAVHATRRLSDGVQVSVDCARGIVQVMPH